MSYTVAQQTRELGIRLALGAESGSVLRLVLNRGLVLAGLGIGIGVAGAYALARRREPARTTRRTVASWCSSDLDKWSGGPPPPPQKKKSPPGPRPNSTPGGGRP